MSLRQRVLGQITQKSATASEALMNGIVAIMHTFTSYKVSDFYGGKLKDPMTASRFFGIAGLVSHLNIELEKQTKRSSKRKRW